MIFSIDKIDLLDMLAAPARIASHGKSMSLACVLVSAYEDGTVCFTATDLVEMAKTTHDALVEEEGCAMMSAAKLYGIVKTLGNGQVTIEADERTCSIASNRSRFDIPSLNPSDFQQMSMTEMSVPVHVPSAMLSAMAKVTAPFASKREDRPILQGVRLACSGSDLRATATDGYRMVDIRYKAEEPFRSGFDVVIPAPFFKEWASTAIEGTDTMISASDTQVGLSCASSMSVTRNITGRYPNCDQFFEGTHSTRAKVDRAELLDALKRASAAGSKSMSVKIEVADGIRLSYSGDDGSYSEDIDAETEGMCHINVNAPYLVDAVNLMPAGKVELLIDNPMKPLMLRGAIVSMVIMPVRA